MASAKPRPHIQRSTQELTDLAKDGTAKLVREIRYELSHRKGRAARNLADELNDAQDAATLPTPSKPAAGNKRPASRAVPPRYAPLPTHRPTDEQATAIRTFREGGSMKISAFAGTGKTSTLQFLANENPRRGLYLAFNKSIAGRRIRLLCVTSEAYARTRGANFSTLSTPASWRIFCCCLSMSLTATRS
jgi:hypothetical protein